jgi:hypothetical protein
MSVNLIVLAALAGVIAVLVIQIAGDIVAMVRATIRWRAARAENDRRAMRR